MKRLPAIAAACAVLGIAACDSASTPTTPLPPVAYGPGHISTTITHIVAVDTAPANYNGGAEYEEFNIHNNSNDSGTATIFCSASNSVTCFRFPDGNTIHLAAHETKNGGWAVSFHTGAANPNGVLRYSTDSGSKDSTLIVVQ